MARRPATVVKELRVATERWDESVEMAHVCAWDLIRVKELIDQLPSFRAAPQTKLENTMRAIESLYQAIGCDLRHTELNPYVTTADQYRDRNGRIVRAIARIINVHYKVGLPAPYDGPIIKIDQFGEAVYEEPPSEDENDYDGTVENTPEPVPVIKIEQLIDDLKVELKDPKYQNVLAPPLKPGEKEPF